MYYFLCGNKCFVFYNFNFHVHRWRKRAVPRLRVLRLLLRRGLSSRWRGEGGGQRAAGRRGARARAAAQKARTGRWEKIIMFFRYFHVIFFMFFHFFSCFLFFYVFLFCNYCYYYFPNNKKFANNKRPIKFLRPAAQKARNGRWDKLKIYIFLKLHQSHEVRQSRKK